MAKRILKHILKNGNEYEVGNHKTYTVTENFTTVTTEATLGTSPYDTSYGYTNITIDENSGIKWKEGAVYSFVVNTEMVVASNRRNVRVRIGSSGSWIPVMDGAGTILNGNNFLQKNNALLFIYKTTHQSTGALHLSGSSVLSVNNKTGNVSINEVSSGGTTGQVLTKTANGYGWANASGGGKFIDIFVVGGGGGSCNGGGGGGGGVIEEHYVKAGGNSISVVVGAGGASCNLNCNGGNSCVGCCIAYGGGGGGTICVNTGRDGGSGGGGQGSNPNYDIVKGGVGMKGQGHPGGAGKYIQNSYYASGGGGGAGEPGFPGGFPKGHWCGTSSYGSDWIKYGGKGGDGVGTDFFGTTIQYFGGGGGGAGYNGFGNGGCGGGGGAGSYPGTANTGGGGSGPGAGGSGIVGIRYPSDGSYGFTSASGGTKSSATIGGVTWCIHTFKSNGTFTIS